MNVKREKEELLPCSDSLSVSSIERMVESAARAEGGEESIFEPSSTECYHIVKPLARDEVDISNSFAGATVETRIPNDDDDQVRKLHAERLSLISSGVYSPRDRIIMELDQAIAQTSQV